MSDDRPRLQPKRGELLIFKKDAHFFCHLVHRVCIGTAQGINTLARKSAACFAQAEKLERSTATVDISNKGDAFLVATCNRQRAGSGPDRLTFQITRSRLSAAKLRWRRWHRVLPPFQTQRANRLACLVCSLSHLKLADEQASAHLIGRTAQIGFAPAEFIVHLT